jgi:hypothetical protein
MDAGGRAPTVGALADAGAVAEAKQKKVIRLRVENPIQIIVALAIL